MFSDLVFTWHSRLYAAFSPIEEVSSLSRIAPMVHFLLKERLDTEEPDIAAIVLRSLLPQPDPVPEKDSKGRELLEEFHTLWDVDGGFWHVYHSDLIDGGKSMFGSAYLAMR